MGLAAAQKALGSPPDLRNPTIMMDGWCTEANASPGLWQGLARLLEAGHAALLAGTYMLGPELQMVLNQDVLFVSARPPTSAPACRWSVACVMLDPLCAAAS